jgi:nephrocystin-3
MNPSPKNRQIRVFISSTFRDFAEERDLLVKKIFPELRRRCRERKVELIDVDLRWGITEEEAQQGKVLPICLAEIDRARPYFMGLIGERYGWVPEADHYDPSLLQEQPWIEEHRGGRSVTELEVLHGVLNNTAMTGRAFFYFRDPAYSTSKGGAYLSEGTADQQKLDALKDRIRQSGFPVVESYPTPEALADKVRDDLWNLIDETFPAGETPDPLAIERGRHEAYSASRLGLYLGGEAYFRTMDAAMAENDAFKPVLIAGASGGGKSALVANWCAAYSENHPETLLHLHHLGAGADAADPVKIVTRLMQEIARITGDELKLEADPQKLFDLLPEWLARASAYASHHGKEWLMVLDGLDKLSTLRDLRWWPAMLPPKVKLVASCLEGEVLESLRKRMEWTDLEVHPLTQTEQRTFITDFLGRYRKSLTPAQVERVKAHSLSGNPLFLLTLLEELRVFGVHEELEQRLSFYLQSETVDDLFERVLERVEGDTSAEAVRSAMEAIWASRAGLAQDELLAITGLFPATWAPIHNALDEAILESGGRLTFGHDYFRKAVEDRYLPSPEKQKAAHLRLAEWFDQQEVTARVAEELPWQWQQVEEDARLKDCLTRQEMFMALHERDEYELLGYWLTIKKDNIETAYEAAWENWVNKLSVPRQAAASYCLARFLATAGIFGQLTEKLFRYSFASHKLLYGLEATSTMRCLSNLGELLLENGDYSEADKINQQAILVNKKVLGVEHILTLYSIRIGALIHHEKGDYKRAKEFYRKALLGYENAHGSECIGALSCITNIASLLSDEGDYDGAELLSRKALETKEKAYGREHPDTLGSVHNLGYLLYRKGNHKGAEALYRRALLGLEKALGPYHPITLSSVCTLGLLLRDTGDHKSAEELIRRALEGIDKTLGPEHPDTLTCCSILGTLLRAKGEYDGAESLHRRALKGAEIALGLEHPRTLGCVNNLAVLFHELGDYEKAEVLYRRTLEGREAALGPRHPDTLASIYNLGNILCDKCAYEEAEELYSRAFEAQEIILGPEHLDTLASINNLACLLRQKGDNEKSEMLFRRVMIGRINTQGSTSPSALESINSLGAMLIHRGKYKEAFQLLESYLNIDSDRFQYNLACCCCNLGKLDEARNLLREHFRSGSPPPLEYAVKDADLSVLHSELIELSVKSSG